MEWGGSEALRDLLGEDCSLQMLISKHLTITGRIRGRAARRHRPRQLESGAESCPARPGRTDAETLQARSSTPCPGRGGQLALAPGRRDGQRGRARVAAAARRREGARAARGVTGGARSPEPHSRLPTRPPPRAPAAPQAHLRAGPRTPGEGDGS